MDQKEKLNKIILFISFIATGILTLPSKVGIGLLVLILISVLLFSNSVDKSSFDLKRMMPGSMKELAFPAFMTFFLLLYFIINCYQRYADSNIVIAIVIGLVLSIFSFIIFCFLRSVQYTPSKEDSTLEAQTKPLLSYIISAIGALITVGLLSQSSPLYPFNNWSDANCFLTVGTAITKGVIPYRDLFEHKGPLLYFIHAACSLIPGKAFGGVFLFQTILLFFTHRILIKLSSFFTRTGILFEILSFPFIMLIYSCNAYFYGDSAEEIMLPFYLYGILTAVRANNKKTSISKKNAFLAGIGAAAAFWIKFTLCGFYIGLIVLMVITSIRNKKIHDLLVQAAYFILACITISVPILLYFLANNALSDLFTVYFYNNIFLYQGSEGAIPLTAKFPYSMMLLFMKLDSNYILTLLILPAILFFSLRKNSKHLPSLITLFVFTFVFVFWGDSQMFYYVFGVAAFAVTGIIPVTKLLVNILDKPKQPVRIILTGALSVALALTSFMTSFATNLIFKPHSMQPQAIFADSIPEDSTLLCYDFPDLGFYTEAGIVPSEKYFCTYMIDNALGESIDQRESAIREGRVDFVVTRNNTYEWSNYEMIDIASIETIDYNGVLGPDYFYLYRLSD